MPLSKTSRRIKLPSRGFGLVELMVSISIMVLVMTVILTRQRAFDNAVLMRNQAYEIAFVLREAQLLAVSGVVETSSNPGAYRRYGVQLNDDGSFLTFRDANADGEYTVDSSGDEQIGAVGQLDRRFDFGDFTSDDGTHSTVFVTFERPNFDAIFHDENGSEVDGPLTISVLPASGGSAERIVSITKAGHIAVQSAAQ